MATVKYDRSAIATMAHRYRRSTGCTFSMAMKAAWNRCRERTLEQLLKDNSCVTFIYMKVDGKTLRTATGTRRKVELAFRDRTPKGTSTVKHKTVNYMDTSLSDTPWRSFRRGYLVKIVGAA